MTPRTTAPTTARRGAGIRAGLSLPAIIEAARSLAPDALTMQALADTLGVDRKAINHYVTDRDTLLSLVATDAFTDSFTATEIAKQRSWQDACRSYARGFAEAAIGTGVLAEHIRLSDQHVSHILEPTEVVLEKMTSAGFDDETAMRTLSLLSNICLAYARDIDLGRRSGTSPRMVILRGALDTRDARAFPTLARIAELQVTTYDAAQLDVSVEIFISGAEAHLRRLREM